MTRPVVFVGYNHKDQRDVERLLAHLRPLQAHTLINLWNDEQIEAGSDWKQQLDQALNQAQVVVLLITPNFLTSNFL